jgi:hypothetical protein
MTCSRARLPLFGANIFAEWVRRLNVAPLVDTDYLAVRNVTLAPEVESTLRSKAPPPKMAFPISNSSSSPCFVHFLSNIIEMHNNRATTDLVIRTK